MRLVAAFLTVLTSVACGAGSPTTPAAPVTPEAAEATFVAALRDRVEAASATDQFSGAVLVARDGRIVFAGAYGRAGREPAPRRAARHIPAGLPQRGGGFERDDPPPADPHRRHGRHLRSGVHG